MCVWGLQYSTDLLRLCIQMVDAAPAPVGKYVPKIPGKAGAEDDVAPIHRIRITLTSRTVKDLEKGESPVVYAVPLPL
jgi:hypothetical protein